MPVLTLAVTLTEWLGPVEPVSLFRLALAAVLGAMVGWERERHGRAAGLRTHMLLCLGCALIMLISLHVPVLFLKYSAQDVLRVDPGRVAAHALSGLGFLGAGAIIVLGGRIRGLTTAASIWVTAAIGLAVGAGYLLPAVFAWVLVIGALLGVGNLEKKMEKKDRFVQLRVAMGEPGKHLKVIEQALRSHGLELVEYTVDRDEGPVYDLTVHYAVTPDFEATTADLADALSGSGLRKVHWH